MNVRVWNGLFIVHRLIQGDGWRGRETPPWGRRAGEGLLVTKLAKEATNVNNEAKSHHEHQT